MTVKRYYPSTYTNPGGWLAPANATLVENNVCANSVLDTALGDFYLYLSNFKDGGGSGSPINLPATAIIDKFVGAFKWTVDNGPYFIYENLSGFFSDHFGIYQSTCGHAFTCATSIYDPFEFLGDSTAYGTPQADMPTVAELNAQTFQFYVDWNILKLGAPFASRARLDAAYLEITYHLPVKAAALMDGFIFLG